MNFAPFERYDWKCLLARDDDDEAVLLAKQNALLGILEASSLVLCFLTQGVSVYRPNL